MHAGDFEPEILQDFLSESFALHERLGKDLAELGPRPADAELLNRIFRGLHTIKGNASFLGLTNLVEIAHAAESALDAARAGRVRMGGAEITLIGAGVEILGIQLGEIRTGRAELTRADADLVASLAALGRADTTGNPPAGTGPTTHDGPTDNRPADAPRTPPGQTVRVEVARIDALEHLVRALSAQSDRLTKLAEHARCAPLHGGPDEPLPPLADGLGRVTRDLRLAVLRTRLQPIDQLFQRYTRVISDLATRTGKRIRLRIEGGSTEVDRRAIEDLGGPLIHLLRNCADHGIETPEERMAAGKCPEGTVRLTARYEGANIRVRIIDDGRGLDRDRIGRKAVERGQCTPDELPGLSDDEVFRFIFGAGFSTMDEVSELSGRGVGMDVVRTNIEHNLNGSIAIDSVRHRGTTLTITFPFKEAIIPALIVATGDRSVAIPQADIIGTALAAPVATGSPGAGMYRTDDGACPLHSVGALLPGAGGPGGTGTGTGEPFVAILDHDGARLAVCAERLIGTEEITVRPSCENTGHPLGGAWARDDAGAAPVLDVGALARLARPSSTRRAA